MKQKTKQAAAKRFQVSARGKISRRHTSQAHFNSRDTGEVGRRKRGNRGVHSTDTHRVHELIPYVV